MRVTKRKAVLVLIAFLFLPPVSYGQLITIQISGKITFLQEAPPNINIGDSITGTYKYDSSASDLEFSNPNFGLYRFSNSPFGINVDIGDYNFQTNSVNVAFEIKVGTYASGTDYYSLYSYSNLPLVPYEVEVSQISWLLTDPTGLTLDNDTLPVVPPNLSDFQNSWPFFQIQLKRGVIRAEITSAVLVPEPATLLLTGLGIVIIRKINHLTK